MAAARCVGTCHVDKFWQTSVSSLLLYSSLIQATLGSLPIAEMSLSQDAQVL